MRKESRSGSHSPESIPGGSGGALEALLEGWVVSNVVLSRLIVSVVGMMGRTLSHSSQALPAPNPKPTKAGQALRLNRRTEKMTPKEAPRVERMRRVLRQVSHCRWVKKSATGWWSLLMKLVCSSQDWWHAFSLRRASLMGLFGFTRTAGTMALEELVESAIAKRVLWVVGWKNWRWRLCPKVHVGGFLLMRRVGYGRRCYFYR